MKRRNRKRNSKAKSPAKFAGIGETPASPSEISVATEIVTNYPDIASDSEIVASPPDILSNPETVAGSPNVPSVAESPASPFVAPTGADRRIYPRYEFTAAVEVLAAESGARIETRVRDLSQQGCYIDTSDALPLGTVTDVRVKKGAQLFEARARVVYSRAAKGMGLVFTAVEAEHVRTLETWLTESRETSWLAANRRRSQRVLMTVPVRVSGKSAAERPFEEETHTRAISAHRALILVSTPVWRGLRLNLSNVQTKAALECVVAHIDKRPGDRTHVGVEFTLPNPMFWHVAFPPKDWTPRHPDAKSRGKAR